MSNKVENTNNIDVEYITEEETLLELQRRRQIRRRMRQYRPIMWGLLATASLTLVALEIISASFIAFFLVFLCATIAEIVIINTKD